MAYFQWPIGEKVPDIWNVIFEKYVTNPMDWKNLSAVNPDYFEPLIYRGNRKWAALFPKVMEILDRKDYLCKQQVLKCRLVSRFWKDAVDKCIRFGNPCFENVQSMHIDECSTSHDEEYCWKQISTKNKSQGLAMFTGGDIKVRKLYDYSTKILTGRFGAEGLGPFLLGHLEFDVKTENVGLHDRMGCLKTILLRFGSYIHHFKLTVSYSESETIGYGILQNFLTLMPNLRSLTIEVINGLVDTSPYKAEILSRPLPDLNHLLILKMSGVTSAVANIFLGKYSCQLKALWMDSGIFASFLLTSAPKLNQITTLQYGRPDSLIAGEHALQWTAILMNKPATTVTLNLIWNEGTFLDLCTFLQVRYVGLKNLQGLNIRFTSSLWDLKTDTPLSLPNIKRLWIHTKLSTLNSIDFILGLSRTLEELTLNLDRVIDITENVHSERINFFSYKERMHSSNVWKLMPKLRKLTIRWRTGNLCNDNLPWICRRYYRPSGCSSG